MDADKRFIKLCKILEKQAWQPITRLEGLEAVKCGFKKNNTPPADGWKPFSFLQGKDQHFWLRTKFATPKARENCRLVLQVYIGDAKGWDVSNPQGLLYLNGQMVQGLDINHTEVFLEPDREYDLYLYLYTSTLSRPFEVFMDLGYLDTEIEGLYYDLQTPLEAMQIQNQNVTEHKDILSCLTQAADLLDMRQVYSPEYKAGIRRAREFMEKAFYQKLCSPEGKPVVHCIGHTHIDVEWLWARNQTREKIQRSFATAKALMDDYPEYRFTLTQPELYRYLKEEAPEKYAELKQLVAQGRWEPEGSMWVECDCNVTGGESLIRQILHGKKFFREEFGVDSKILFLPDVFGYSAALPQILKKSGIDYFVTSKISWNDTNTMPNDTFCWQGIDGTDILTYFITTGTATPNHEMRRFGGYIGMNTPSHILGTWDRYKQKQHCKHTLTTFGYGDGGGGPTRRMLELRRRMDRGIPGIPVTKSDFLLPFLQTVEKEFTENCRKLRSTPRWKGELYLEFHRGTYTSVAKNKKNNRKSELALQKSEALSYTDLFHGGSYDAEGIYHSWRKVLHNQFHDILPGSSIREVYDGTDADYAQISAFCGDVISSKLAAIAGKLNTKGGLLVYNPLGFARGGHICVNGETVALPQPIPGFGWAVVDAFDTENSVTVSGLAAENAHYRMTLDKAGRIISLFDKDANREVFAEGQKGNELQVFDDRPFDYDVWEMSEYYKSNMYVLDVPAVITPITDGCRSGFRVERTYYDSRICQNIWLYNDSRRIDFDTELDWHEKDQILKTAFPLDIFTDKATYEIQFGHVSRPTHTNTGWDQAKFEVCAHKWADLSENGYGVALLNDCKYGFSTEGSTLKLTMLKCSPHPDPNPDNTYADQGKHTFSYALLPHVGTLYDANVIREAYSFNQPFETLPIAAQAGILPESYSLVSCDDANVVVETAKKAEASDDLVVRLYETFCSRGSATLQVAEGFREVWLCDMLENELEKLAFSNNCVTIPLKHFEIVTLKFKL